MTDTFKQDILELLDTIQNFEVRVSLLETKYMDLELDMRSVEVEKVINGCVILLFSGPRRRSVRLVPGNRELWT